MLLPTSYCRERATLRLIFVFTIRRAGATIRQRKKTTIRELSGARILCQDFGIAYNGFVAFKTKRRSGRALGVLWAYSERALGVLRASLGMPWACSGGHALGMLWALSGPASGILRARSWRALCVLWVCSGRGLGTLGVLWAPLGLLRACSGRALGVL